MKCMAITHKGTESIAAKEILELIKSAGEIHDTCVIFSCSKLEELALLCYKAQSVKKIMILHAFFEIGDIYSQLSENFSQFDFSHWVDKDTSFKVESERVANKLDGGELASLTGEIIIDIIQKKYGFTPKVDLEKPDIIFFVYIVGTTSYLGIDFAGKDLTKRSYKIYNSAVSLKGTIAYSLLRFADYSEKDVILDPFCRSGEIVIEAAIFASHFPINYFTKEQFAFLKLKPFAKIEVDKFYSKIDKDIAEPPSKIIAYDANQKYVMQAKKNAKIAGIHKFTVITRQDVEWIELKQKEKSIDKIITYPLQPSRYTNPNMIAKLYNEFFYQAEFILKETGIIAVLTISLDLLEIAAKKNNFELIFQHIVWTGEQKLIIGIYKRKKN
jgi:putative N6-adenine-specific DNA methylase